jgi:hypothetical protein
LEAVSHLLRLEMAELMGTEEYANELREEWRQDQAAQKKEERRVWTTWGVVGAAELAWWWFHREPLGSTRSSMTATA